MSPNTKNTILLVNDDPDLLDLTEKFLKLGDFNTITCSNANELLRVIEERYNDIAMILLNPMMQGLNENEFLKSVKSDDRYKHILVVLFIDKNFIEDIWKDKTLGADGYITKPFSGKELIGNIEKMKSGVEINNSYLEELKEEYQIYKKKEYNFGRYYGYGIREQIQNEFSKGKIFVLKGGLRIEDWILMITLYGAGLIGFIITLFYSMGMGIALFIFYLLFFVFITLIFLIKLRNFLVIGPLGVYYRKIIRSGSFSWSNVSRIEGIERFRSKFFITTFIATIYLSSGEKIRFQSRTYLNKEFPRESEGEMFFKLLDTYFKLREYRPINFI